ncbi:OmpA family protein [Lysobacter sp. CCNWLW3]|uniref:OmpA family protein n=1 Tax=unclassified Lysobacter TaxID=2635362 RepID=UPI002FCE89C6
MNRSICGVRAYSVEPLRAVLGRTLRNVFFLGALALAIVPTAHAQTSVDNVARVSNPAGLSCSDAATNPTCERIDNAVVGVTPAVPAYDFCPSTGAKPVFSLANGVRISAYPPGSANDAFVTELDFAIAGDLNALMVDPVRNRLLFVSRSGGNTLLWAYDAANGGWYQAAAPFASADFPRAGMGPNGVGYLISGGSATPDVWRVTADPTPGSFGYTVQNIGTLSYDIAPTNLSSGDIALDGDGMGWLSAGQDLYRIDFGASLQAVRQVRPLLNGAPSTISWAGVAFADDGRLFVADNGASSSYYAYDPATGVLTQSAPTVAVASRDLASCAFPTLAAADLSVNKTLAQINGVPAAAGATVAAGDTLTYAVQLSNSGGTVTTVFAGEVVETLPANTTVVTAGNDFTCSGSNCPNTAAVNVPAGNSVTLDFVVQVVAPLPGNIASIDNAVTVAGVDCAAAGNDCTETTPLAPTLTVAKSVNPASGTAVSVGDTLSYTLTVEVANGVTVNPEVLTDTLGAGLAVATLPAGCTAAGQVVTCTLPAGSAIGSHSFSYTATVSADAVTSVSNTVVPSSGSCTTCTTTNPVDPTLTVAKSANPASGTAVSVGDTLSYTLSVTVANAVTTAPEVLTDTLGAGLNVGTLPAGCTAAGQVITCTLPAGSAIGTHGFNYTATVDAAATTSVSNTVVPSSGSCTSCTTTNPINPTIAVAKSVNPASGTAVSVGDTLSYTLNVTVANAVTTAPEVLTDTLGAGLTVATLPAACTASGQVITCTLPAGSAIGGHSFSYTATVDAAATTSVSNSVVPSSGSCTSCTTTNPVNPTIAVAKSVNPASGTAVSVGDTLTYTLTVTVANAATTAPEVLTDTLGAGLTVATLPAGCSAAGQVITCTLAAGSAVGSHSFSYTATVDAAATASVSNTVVPSSGSCVSCTTTNPINPTIAVAKSVNPASGTAVSVGDTLSYTLTVTVANAATTAPEVLTDTLGAGLSVGTLPAGCSAAGQVITCTLPAGSAIGSHAFTYNATVAAAATTSVSNSVVPSSGSCTNCTTTNPVNPTIAVAKSVNPGSGTAVSVGDTLSYTLSVTVANAVTTAPEVLTDTLGAGLNVGTLPAGCTAAGQVITCTLPAGSAIGTHSFNYTATVDAAATTSVSNSVVPSSGSCTSCTTVNPVDPTVTVAKSVNPGSGTAVSVGDTLSYTLTVIVANAATTAPEVLTDTLGAGLTVGTVPAGCSAAGQVVTCTLPAGSAIGSYSFNYTATVAASAATSVSNSVVPSSGGCTTCTTTNPVNPTLSVNKSVNPASGTAVSVGDTLSYTLSVTVANAATSAPEVLTDTLGAGLNVGTLPAGCSAAGQVITCTLPAGSAIGTHSFNYTATVDAAATTSVSNTVVPSSAICGTCTTTNPVDPTLTVAKSVNPASGTAVSVGDTLTYTLTVTVANAITSNNEVLTDTLGAGLTIGSVPAGCSAAGQVVTCTLPAGSAIGSHTYTYTATVAASATTSVSNSVVPSSGTCGTCTTVNPLLPTIDVSKSVNPAGGTTVSVGDTLTYTLTVDVANAATTAPEVLTDTLGAGLTVGTLPAGCSASGQVITCTLAAGSAIGSYSFVYTATVDAAATTSVSNSVVPSSGNCVGCTTTNPVAAVITVAKSVNPGSGTAVSVGDTLDYTLSVTVANAATTAPEVLTDTLGAGLAIGALPAGCGAAGQVITCTLPAGSAIGTHSFAYTATVTASATTSVSNSVVPSSGNCVGCTTTNPVTPTLTVAKSVSPGNGTTVAVGDTLNYTLSVTVANAATGAPEVLTDTLGAGLAVGTLPAGCAAAGQVVTCTLPAGSAIGTHTFAYTATVTASATTAVNNSVTASSGNCTACTTSNPVAPMITVAKSVNPGSGTAVSVGDTLTYTLTVNVANAATAAPEVLTDTLGAGLTVATVPAGCSASGQVITCTVPAGSAIGGYNFVYTATVAASATASVSNSVTASSGNCVSCSTSNPVTPTITVAKSVNPASGSAVSVGDTLTYTLTVNVANAATATPEVLTDTLGAGLTVGTLPAGCGAAGQVITCTVPAGSAIGSYNFVYTATVAASATTSVSNSVVASTGTCTSCSTTNPVSSTVTVAKSANPASGTAVSVGDTLSYTLTVTVANAVTAAPVVLTDTLGAGLSVGALPDGCHAAGQTITCTLAAGAAIGSHDFNYTATVGADASVSVANSVTTSVGSCTACATSHPVAPRIAVNKTADPASGETVEANQLITYTVTVTVGNAPTTQALTLTDTLSAGQTLQTGSIQAPAGGSCNAVAGGLACGLAAGAAPGSYAFVYQVRVDAGATGSIGNSVAASGGGGVGPQCQVCQTEHRIAVPVVDVSKSSAPGGDAVLRVGDTLQYTLTVNVSQATTTAEVVLEDTPSAGLTLGALPAGCTASSTGLRCVLPAGTAPGSYAFTYPATINADAGGTVSNVVVANGGGGSQLPPSCLNCATTHRVDSPALLRVIKTSAVREARIGDLVRYTITVENVGDTNVRGATLVDTPPAGFSYVDGSLSVVDGDNAATASGYNPIRFAGLDIDVGRSASLVYLMRIGAGVRTGVQINQAQAYSSVGRPISNVATAEVALAADPLVDDSLILGTVFDDRDGDGWQDRADLSGVRVQGGFDPAAYVPGSTTIDRGAGPQPVADASAPLLHGIDLGDIGARQSPADPVQLRQIVLRQRLSRPDFRDDFVLTTREGASLRMDAAGRTTLSTQGEAAKGLNAALPQVERRVAQGEGGYVVDYVIGNAGIDERGIPGVRIASVDGLLVETDQYGRYHLAGIPGGAWARGRNFILKADPSTLPAGTALTTDNPLIRRITPGLPVRFDFGAKLPDETVPGAERRVELDLGEVIFAPGSAQLRERYLPALDRIAARIAEYGGGEVVIVADGDSEALAFDRAAAVKDALLSRLPKDVAQALSVSARTVANDRDSLVAGVGQAGPRLGTVLFDTDSAAIKPEFLPLVERIAAHLEQTRGGTVTLVGHADMRSAADYNLALGMRRARAVYEAIASRLSAQTRSQVRVESSNEPAAPAGSGK